MLSPVPPATTRTAAGVGRDGPPGRHEPGERGLAAEGGLEQVGTPASSPGREVAGAGGVPAVGERRRCPARLRWPAGSRGGGARLGAGGRAGSASRIQRSLLDGERRHEDAADRVGALVGPPISRTRSSAAAAGGCRSRAAPCAPALRRTSRATMPCCWAADRDGLGAVEQTRRTPRRAPPARRGGPPRCPAGGAPGRWSSTVPSSASTSRALVDWVDESIPRTAVMGGIQTDRGPARQGGDDVGNLLPPSG